MSAKLEEMLRIAQAATKGKWTWGSRWICQKRGDGDYAYLAAVPPGEEDGDRWNKDAQHIATFNPRTAEALVKVALAAEASARKRATWRRFRGVDASHDDWPKQVEDADQAMIEALSALTAAMASEDGQSPAEGLSTSEASSEEDSSNVG